MNYTKTLAHLSAEYLKRLSRDIRRGNSILGDPLLITIPVVATASLLCNPDTLMSAYRDVANFLHLYPLGNIIDGFRVGMLESPRTIEASFIGRSLAATPIVTAAGLTALAAGDTMVRSSTVVNKLADTLAAYAQR